MVCCHLSIPISGRSRGSAETLDWGYFCIRCGFDPSFATESLREPGVRSSHCLSVHCCSGKHPLTPAVPQASSLVPHQAGAALCLRVLPWGACPPLHCEPLRAGSGLFHPFSSRVQRRAGHTTHAPARRAELSRTEATLLEMPGGIAHRARVSDAVRWHMDARSKSFMYLLNVSSFYGN